MSRVRGDSVNKAIELILQKIYNYELLSGDVVSDLELSKQFNMSRTPIREAIMTLINSGIIERTKTRNIVKAVTMTDIIEILEVREAIEVKSAEIIITQNKLTEDMKSTLLTVQESLSDNIVSAKFDKNYDDDNNFHSKLVEYAGNERFIQIYKQISLQSQRLRWISMLTPFRYGETDKEHKIITNALIAGDLELAISSVKKHLLNTKKNYETILDNSQWNKIAHEIKFMRMRND